MITLRRMNESDLPLLAQLERENFSDPWSKDAFREELDVPYSLTLVAEADGSVAGYLNAHIVYENIHINTFCVAAPFRKQGIGRKLLEETLGLAARSGAVEATLEVRAGNEAAQRLYRAAGFVPVGIRKGFYRVPTEDALILKKEFPHD